MSKTLRIADNLTLPLEAVTQTFATANLAIAWAAGLFEGEGCIAYVPSGNGIRRALFVGSTDLDVLQLLQSVLAAGAIRTMKVQGNRKPAWRWEVQDWKNVQRIALLLLPYLRSRRRARMEFLLSHPPKRGVGRCYAGHPLRGPDADVYTRSDGRPPQCAVCARRREKARRLQCIAS